MEVYSLVQDEIIPLRKEVAELKGMLAQLLANQKLQTRNDSFRNKMKQQTTAMK